MVNRLTCSPLELFSLLLCKVFSHSKRPKKMNISIISFFRVSSINTGKKLAVKTYRQSSRTSSWKCSAMMDPRDQLWNNSNLIHGCKSHLTWSKVEPIFWKSSKSKDPQRQLIPPPEMAVAQEETQCWNSWDRSPWEISSVMLSMTWPITILIMNQELSSKNWTISTANISIQKWKLRAISTKNGSNWM